jgi:transcriptional antiterminator RfaH
MWIVAMTRPAHEAIAALNLSRQGYTSYVPKYAKRQGQKASVIRPLFPRYIFIQVEQFWSSILGTRGISRVLLADEGPAQLPDRIIKELKARELHGLIQLTTPSKFLPGEKVKTETGPLVGHLLIYEGQSSHDRVKVLANLLGRACVIELPEKSLIAA